MTRKYILISPILALFLTLTVYAANPFNIQFPITELGNCASLDACRTYCDDTAHADACLAYGQSHGLIKKEDSDKNSKAKDIIKSGGGPGGCNSLDACRQYCADSSHADECTAFLKKIGISNPNPQQQTLRDAIAKGDVPVAGCTSEETCKRLCSLPENHDACVAWAKNHGLIREDNGQGKPSPSPRPETEGINKDKALKAIQQNGGPGGCKSLDDCRLFCSKPENQKICSDYARKYSLTSSGGNNNPASHSEGSPRPMPPGLSQECLKAKESGDYERARQLCNLPPRPSVSPGSSPKPLPLSSKEPKPTSNYDLQKYCAQNGGVWSDSDPHCRFPNKTPGPTPNYQQECLEHGGTWNGSTCIRPSISPKPTNESSTSHGAGSIFQVFRRFLFGE